MDNKIRQRIETNLIDEINNLSSVEIELVGHYLLCVLEGIELVHHGTNKDGQFTGYTVDTFSQDGTIVGEYSVEKGYFTTYTKQDEEKRVYEKIHKDIQHALKHSGEKLKRIYLITSQIEPPSFRKEFNQSDDFKDNSGIITIYDARLLAKEIYNQSVDNVNYFQFYKDFFPHFAHELDNYEYYGKMPPLCDNFCEDKSVLEKIDRHYQNGNNICLLYGISGSGKTQTAINYVHYQASEFQNYIWVAGEDWKKDTSLSAVQRARGGMPVNVVGLFNKSKTILVIDSLEREVKEKDFDELEEGFNKGGRIIITSQLKSSTKFCMQMPELAESVSISILGDDSNEDIVKKIINKCKGLPIVLSTIRNMILYEEIAKGDLYAEIMSKPGELMPEGGVPLFRNVLSKLPPDTQKQLIKLANSGMSTFDIDFVRFYCGIISCNTLQKLSILMTTYVPGIVKIHDLICVAMKKEDNSCDIVIKLEEYINSKKGEMTPSILRQIYLMRQHIARYKKEHLEKDWLTYALLQIEGDDKNKIVDEIWEQQFTEDMNLPTVMCLIEAKELRAYQLSEREKVDKYFNQIIMEYEKAIRLYSDIDVIAELQHHLGKAYRRSKRWEEAYECFKKLLDSKPNWYATYGQILSLGIGKVPDEIKDDANNCMRILLTDMLEDANRVPLRVSLATIAKMRSYKEISTEIIDSVEKVEKICQIVAGAALEDIGQFFEGFVAVSSMFVYHYSKVCLNLAESVPDMIMVSPEMVEKMQWLNACEALANIAVSAQNENKHELFDMLINKSVEFGEAYWNDTQVNAYAARAIAKTYIIKGEGSKALDVINEISEETRDHWLLYRQAEAENMIEDSKAIETAKKAVDLLKKDSKNVIRISSYYHLLAKCYFNNGNNEQAYKTVEKAINSCRDPKYKEELEEYLRQIEECKTITR